jgi:hypothetical protein
MTAATGAHRPASRSCRKHSTFQQQKEMSGRPGVRTAQARSNSDLLRRLRRLWGWGLWGRSLWGWRLSRWRGLRSRSLRRRRFRRRRLWGWCLRWCRFWRRSRFGRWRRFRSHCRWCFRSRSRSGRFGRRRLNLGSLPFLPIHKIGSNDKGEHDSTQNDRKERSAAALIVVCHRNYLPLDVGVVQTKTSLARNRPWVEG